MLTTIAGATVGEDQAHELLRHQEHAAEVDGDQLVPVLDGQVDEGRAVADSRVVGQDVERAGLGLGVGDCTAYLLGVGHIAHRPGRTVKVLEHLADVLSHGPQDVHAALLVEESRTVASPMPRVPPDTRTPLSVRPLTGHLTGTRTALIGRRAVGHRVEDAGIREPHGVTQSGRGRRRSSPRRRTPRGCTRMSRRCDARRGPVSCRRG